MLDLLVMTAIGSMAVVALQQEGKGPTAVAVHARLAACGAGAGPRSLGFVGVANTPASTAAHR